MYFAIIDLKLELPINVLRYFDFWQGARRREFRYIYKPGNPFKTRERAYFFHIFKPQREISVNFKEIGALMSIKCL